MLTQLSPGKGPWVGINPTNEVNAGVGSRSDFPLLFGCQTCLWRVNMSNINTSKVLDLSRAKSMQVCRMCNLPYKCTFIKDCWMFYSRAAGVKIMHLPKTLLYIIWEKHYYHLLEKHNLTCTRTKKYVPM